MLGRRAAFLSIRLRRIAAYPPVAAAGGLLLAWCPNGRANELGGGERIPPLLIASEPKAKNRKKPNTIGKPKNKQNPKHGFLTTVFGFYSVGFNAPFGLGSFALSGGRALALLDSRPPSAALFMAIALQKLARRGTMAAYRLPLLFFYGPNTKKPWEPWPSLRFFVRDKPRAAARNRLSGELLILRLSRRANNGGFALLRRRSVEYIQLRLFSL